MQTHLRCKEQELDVLLIVSKLNKALHADSAIDCIHKYIEFVHSTKWIVCYFSKGENERNCGE